MDITVKLYNLYDSILEDQIQKYKILVLNDSKNNIHKECKIFLELACNSLQNSLNLLENNDFVDALALLRCSYESILFSIGLYFDEKLYMVYKHHDNNIYQQALKEKYRKLREKNPKFKEPKKKDKNQNYLKPKNIRKIVSNNYKIVFRTFFNYCKNSKDVYEELSKFYQYLCDFTHPTTCKIYVYKIQNEKECLRNINIIFKVNIYYCKILLLLSMNFFSKQDNIDKFIDLYGINILLLIAQVDDVSNLKQILKKYEEYLYIDIIKSYLKPNQAKINELQKEIKQINCNNNSGKFFGEMMLDIIKEFGAESRFNEYFKDDGLVLK